MVVEVAALSRLEVVVDLLEAQEGDLVGVLEAMVVHLLKRKRKETHRK